MIQLSIELIDIVKSGCRGDKMDYRTQVYVGLKKCVISDYVYDLKWDDLIMYPAFEKCYEQLIEEHSQIILIIRITKKEFCGLSILITM